MSSTDQGERTVSPKALKMCTESMNLRYKKQFSLVFYKNAAEFYDNHIFITMICIFWPEFGLKPRYVALYVTENGNVFLNIAPPFHTRTY